MSLIENIKSEPFEIENVKIENESLLHDEQTASSSEVLPIEMIKSEDGEHNSAIENIKSESCENENVKIEYESPFRDDQVASSSIVKTIEWIKKEEDGHIKSEIKTEDAVVSFGESASYSGKINFGLPSN